MLAKVAGIEKRYKEIEIELAKPETLADQDKYKALSKEYSEMKEIVDAIRELKTVTAQLAELTELLKDETEPEMRAFIEKETEDLRPRVAELEEKLKILLLPKDPADTKNVIMEIRAGAGGEEAALFARELYRLYTKFAEFEQMEDGNDERQRGRRRRL